MRKHSILFLAVAVLAGVLGFSGLNFAGIEVVRILFLIFADLLVVSLLARLFFDDKKRKMQRVKSK